MCIKILNFLTVATAPLLGGRARLAVAASLSIVLLSLTGCRGLPVHGEKETRQQAQTVTGLFRPQGQPPDLSTLATNSDLGGLLRFAMLNQPQIEAKYYDWILSVERITVERSLPDPKLTFQAYIQDVLTSLMPGLMQEFPGPGKLQAAARVATAESRAKYFQFETVVLQAAFEVKRAFYNLHFLDERVRINREMLHLLAQLEETARSQNQVGKVTLQDVYRAQIEQDQLATEVANLEDSRHPLLAQFKGALGLTSQQSDPPVPAEVESTPLDLNADDLLATAFARNPRLKAMEAEVRMAEANIAVARKSRVPDFSAGLQAEVYTPPFYWPQASMSLPIWRDKIAAQIAGAQAGKRAAEARLSSEQISLTVDFAMKSFDYREVTRTLALLQNQLIPKARKSLEIARSGYLSGQIEFFNLIDAERTLLNFQLSEVQARARRETTLAELSLIIAGVSPAGAPLLAAPPQVSSSGPKPSGKGPP
jgi:outer membrane protein, heavy metal efflux system